MGVKDREDVIKAIETHIKPVGSHDCKECTYENDGWCTTRVLTDALALLREDEKQIAYRDQCYNALLDDWYKMLDNQTPTEPVQNGQVRVGTWWYGCGACKKPIDYKDMFCRHCGKAVKW